MLPQITRLKRAALDLLFPPYCLGCGREGNYFCGRCARELTYISPPVCRICGRPLTPDGHCPGCISIQHEIDGIRAPFLFEGLIRKAIHDFKYNNLRSLSPFLASYLSEFLVENPLPGEVLVPVPVHPKRLRERGYNQTSLLAFELGKLTGMRVDNGSLIRSVYNTPQAKLSSGTERLQAAAGAFTCRDNKLQGEKVILIDDVSTSGATLNACAAALKEAGATSVWGLTLALEL